MLPIDKAICLSRRDRQDRRTSITAQWQLLIDTNTVPNRHVEWFDAEPKEAMLIPASWRKLPGYYAATRDHMRIMEYLWKDTTWQVVLILEDDAKFSSKFSTSIDKVWSDLTTYAPDWLALFLGGTLQTPCTSITSLLAINNGSTQSHAYIVNRHGLWRLFDHLFCTQFEIVDWSYNSLMQHDKAFYCTTPWLVGTMPSYSNNQETFDQGTHA
jgi:GR25 family glycosyltransferase involved in LPS biosynthesis